MRTLMAAVFGVVLFLAPPYTFGQEAAPPQIPRPKKVLTPAQQKFQAEGREISAQQDVLRTQATTAFNAEMVREKAGDCPNANNTYEINLCLGKAIETTDQNLTTYEQALRSFIGLRYPTMPGDSASSMVVDKRVADFDHVEQLWRDYALASCRAVYGQFVGGTGAPSAEAECHLRLARNHLRELDANYETQLHH